jgi:glycosyltransferase involved in cell wall biosynthesis
MTSNGTHCDDAIRMAVLIPCHNEAASIAMVVDEFRAALPRAIIYVFDNNSTDDTVVLAAESGAVVRSEPWQGKGNVVRRMFADVDADVYVLVDGDGTYDSGRAPDLVNTLIEDGLDMVSAARVASTGGAFRRGHKAGNRLLTWMVATVFGRRFTDMLSGYRVFSRRFVKSFPALTTGFEIETELTVHALELRMPIAEVQARYFERPEGSSSKLRTYSDGLRILRTIVVLVKEERPLQFFSTGFAVLSAASLALGWRVIAEFVATGLVPRFPTAILATGLMLLAFLSLTCGLVLDTVTRGRRELKRLQYLQIPIRQSRRANRRDPVARN